MRDLGSEMFFGLLLLLSSSKWSVAQDPAPNVIDALAGLKTQINTVNSTAELTCESSRMMVNLTFAQPFFGKVFAENKESDPACWLIGRGLRSYQYPVPLKECGTRQISLREFENTLQIRFGNTEKIELADERKTILCRYPPPVVPPILPIPPPVVGAVPPVPAASVSELELLLIIAAVLFLGLLLLGLCCAWWCCKRRRAAKIVESEGILIEAPDVMKLSGTTLPFVIPRATASGSDSGASESALINRLEEEVFPIVPYAGNEVIRIPHITQLSKGYELQEASMKVPASIAAASEIAEGETETRDTTLDREIEHIAVFAPPIPLRPPSPRYVPPPAPFNRQDYDRETVSDLTETEIEHTLIAGRIPAKPPSSVRSDNYDMRSVSVLSDESITRSQITPRPPAPRLPPFKSVTTEMETETHSVVESLENELILRAVPKQQPRLMPPPSEQPYYPTDTRTETSVVSERLERFYPPSSVGPRPTMMSDDRRGGEERRPRPPPPGPDTTTTHTVTETNISRDIEVYPPFAPLTQNDDRRGHEERRHPPSTTTHTTRETNIQRENEFYPPSSYGPPTTTTHTTRETNIQRQTEVYPPQPVRPPSTTTTTRTETDTRRDFQVVRPPPPAPPSDITTTRTTKETNIQRNFEVYPPGPRYPGGQTTTTTTRTREESMSPERPFEPEFVDTTLDTLTERNVTRESTLYPPQGPRYRQEPYGTNDRTTTTRIHRETNIRRDYEYPGGVLPRDGSISPDYPDTITTTTDRRRDTTTTDYRQLPHPDTTSRTTDHRQQQVYRGSRHTYRNEPENEFRDYPPSPDELLEDYPDRDGPSTTFVSSATRDIQKQIDVGTPPDGSGPGSETSQDNGPTSRTLTKTNVAREFTVQLPGTSTAPRPLREPWQPTGSTTTTTSRHQTDLRQYAEAIPSFQATPSYKPFRRPSPPTTTTPAVLVHPRPQPHRQPVDWEEMYNVIYGPRPSGSPGPAHSTTTISQSLSQHEIDKLRELVIYDQEFQLNITRVRTVYDLYYIRYTPPYDEYFVQTTWTVIIRIFVIVLELPHPHPDDPDFIEPQPEWFSRPSPMSFGGGRSDASSASSSATMTNVSSAERAMSELTEDVPRISPPRRTDGWTDGQTFEKSDDSDAGSSGWIGSPPQRQGSGEYATSERSVERSVAEYFEEAPTVTTTRSYRGVQRTTRGGATGPTSKL
ncbi:hypothetical protein BV898_14448 [Hypsibius exemplaris]|uniref:ZP domain-containing protein n=1 Tax=Hypsibius exemplaris TaxID=2072580 RepID=A0A9X6NC57_HYPEX|nr:hypothetical protein BV898_14448 [Hypsibius exemplaris]